MSEMILASCYEWNDLSLAILSERHQTSWVLRQLRRRRRQHAGKAKLWRAAFYCLMTLWMYSMYLWVPKSHLFWRLCNLTESLMAYVFGTQHDIDNRASALTTRRSVYVVSKCHELWSTNDLKLDRNFYPPHVNSALYFIARLRRQR